MRTKNQSTILIVEDESTIREVLRRYLEREGFCVLESRDGYEAMDQLATVTPDLILLDLMLPGIDGLTITRNLRQTGSAERQNIPIIMLTAKGEPSDRIRGLNIGADDYIPKPFSPSEVVSRVNAVLRRSGRQAVEPGKIITFPTITIDTGAHEVLVDNKPVMLSAKEFDLLLFFAQNPRQVFSRSQLLDNVWGFDYFGDSSTVTVHIRRLREKIEPDPSHPTYIETVWGVGYRFNMEES